MRIPIKLRLPYFKESVGGEGWRGRESKEGEAGRKEEPCQGREGGKEGQEEPEASQEGLGVHQPIRSNQMPFHQSYHDNKPNNATLCIICMTYIFC